MPTTPKGHPIRVASVDALHALALRGAAGALPDWYDREGSALADWARSHGLEAAHVAAVVAVTSPQVPVARNGALAREYLLHGTLTGAIPSTAAAVEYYARTGRIRGPKTGAFADALLGDGDALVLDVHMLRAFDARYLDSGRWKRLGQGTLYRKYLYPTLRARVEAVARREGWSVRDTQAAIWFGARRIRHADSLGF